MKLRIRRRVNLGKHVHFNLSKSGISTSFSFFGITVNPKRNRYHVNLPIVGLYLDGKLSDVIEGTPKDNKTEKANREARIAELEAELAKLKNKK